MLPVLTPHEAANVLLSIAGPSGLPSGTAPQAPKSKVVQVSAPAIPKLTAADTRAVVDAAFARCTPKTQRRTVIAKPCTAWKKNNPASSDVGVSHVPPGWPSAIQAIRPPKGLLKTPLTKEMAAILEYEFTDKKNWYPTYMRVRELSDKTGLLAIETSMWFKFRRCAKNAHAQIAANLRAKKEKAEKEKAAPLK